MRTYTAWLLAACLGALFAATPLAKAGNSATVEVTAQMRAWLDYGPEADGRGMLVLTKEGKYLEIGLGSADFPELEKARCGDLLSLRVQPWEDTNAVLQITVSQYSYVDGSAKILAPVKK